MQRYGDYSGYAIPKDWDFNPRRYRKCRILKDRRPSHRGVLLYALETRWMAGHILHTVATTEVDACQ